MLLSRHLSLALSVGASSSWEMRAALLPAGGLFVIEALRWMASVQNVWKTAQKGKSKSAILSNADFDERWEWLLAVSV